MKTFPFIVINKNNMKSIQHFATANCVAAYFLGRKVANHIIIVNEKVEILY